jgi:formylglycine-generating enzyme required for sulfatase activity
MGQENGRDDERPVHRVTLAPFRLARTTVTNASYDAFCRATARERHHVYGGPGHPVTSVNWFDAVAYCHWIGARLPTEAEWEFAARGGFEQRLYPWGNEAPAFPPDRWQHGPEPVAQDPPNPYGLFDMGQNIHEWCSDWYDAGYYAVSPAENPRGPEHGTRRASRGGAWRHHIKVSRCAARSSIPPEFRYADYGFRIAAD